MERFRILLPLTAMVVTSTAWSANAVGVKNWFYVNDGNGSAEAYTVNESGSQIGVYCAAKSNCFAYFVSADSTCSDGDKYPALMNSTSGAVALTVVCRQLASDSEKSRYVLVINEMNAVLTAMLKDHTLGIVIPMQSGTFHVARFSLEGSNEALAAVDRMVEAQPKPATTTTGDKDL